MEYLLALIFIHKSDLLTTLPEESIHDIEKQAGNRDFFLVTAVYISGHTKPKDFFFLHGRPSLL
jgi:hypothetical protein